MRDWRAGPVRPVGAHVEVVAVIGVLEAGQLARDAVSLVEEEVEVIMVEVRVAAKVGLQTVAAVSSAGGLRDEDVVVRVVCRQRRSGN